MANRSRILPDNAPGEFYVDNTCIDCGACRNFAPSVFAGASDHSFVAAQPVSETDRTRAFLALLACPTNSIGAAARDPKTGVFTSTKVPKGVHDSFPMELEAGSGVHINGFNHRDSFGADSYFIRSPGGNWLVDSPRFHPHLLERFHKEGGLAYIFLTHQDDVADAGKYAKEFGAKRIIHEGDLRGCPDAEIVMKGNEDLVIGDARIIFTPGHTRGHAVLLWKDRFLFTGDHLPWDSGANALRPFNGACWYSWGEQIRSVEKLAALSGVAHVLTGHGERWHRSAAPGGDFPALIAEAVGWMKTRRAARP